MTIVRNAVSSAGERLFTAALTLVSVPILIRLLGMEAYGLLGFVTSLQVLFNILDFGLGPTVIREIAADTSQTRAHSRALIRTFSGAYWSLAVCAGLLLTLGAPWLSTRWLHSDTIPAATVVLAIRLVAITVLLRWPVALYAGVIAGSQRLDVVNVIRVAVSACRLLGGLVVVLQFKTLTSYLLWLTLTAVAEVGCYITVTSRLAPHLSLTPGFSREALQKVWPFSLHMNLISLLTALLVQSDRLVISRTLTLTDLGYYSAAYSLVSGLSLFQSVVTTALFPALAQHLGPQHALRVKQWCTVSTEVLMYLVCGASGALVFYGYDGMAAWISQDMALRASSVASILAVGFVTGAAVSVPYTLAVSVGHTSVPLAINVAAAIVYVPLVYSLVQIWGINGAAGAWVGLNLYYLVVLVPILQRGIPMEPVSRWFAKHVLPFAATSVVMVGGSRLVLRTMGATGTGPVVAGLVIGGALYAVAAFAFLDRNISAQLRAYFRELRYSNGAPAA